MAELPNDDLLLEFGRALALGNELAVTDLLERAPALARSHPWHSEQSALDVVADRCVRHLPAMHRLAGLLVDAGTPAPVATAARAGLISVVRELLDRDPSALDAKDARGRTPLYRASCVNGMFAEGEAVADLLLASGAEVDLSTAATLGLTAHVDRLLANPRAASAVDPDGMTALHWAVRPRRDPAAAVGIVERLLAAGADVDAINLSARKMRPLHHAAEWPAPIEVVDLLLANGAALDAESADGWTPLDFAIERERTEMADALRERGARPGSRRQDLD